MSGQIIPGSPWPARDEELRALWIDGRSGSQIAQAMGLTKNQIIGRAHRIKLPARSSPIAGQCTRPAAPKRWTEPQIERLKELWAANVSERGMREKLGMGAQAIATMAKRLGLPARDVSAIISASMQRAPRYAGPVELSATAKCQWIEGEPSADDACKCGRPALVGRSWCPDHFARVYIRKGSPQYVHEYNKQMATASFIRTPGAAHLVPANLGDIAS